VPILDKHDSECSQLPRGMFFLSSTGSKRSHDVDDGDEDDDDDSRR
jgi:hypothetical protein